jgi:hypothetical protein
MPRIGSAAYRPVMPRTGPSVIARSCRVARVGRNRPSARSISGVVGYSRRSAALANLRYPAFPIARLPSRCRSIVTPTRRGEAWPNRSGRPAARRMLMETSAWRTRRRARTCHERSCRAGITAHSRQIWTFASRIRTAWDSKCALQLKRVGRCSASALNNDLQVNGRASLCDEFGGAQSSN